MPLGPGTLDAEPQLQRHHYSFRGCRDGYALLYTPIIEKRCACESIYAARDVLFACLYPLS